MWNVLYKHKLNDDFGTCVAMAVKENTSGCFNKYSYVVGLVRNDRFIVEFMRDCIYEMVLREYEKRLNESLRIVNKQNELNNYTSSGNNPRPPRDWGDN